MGAMKTKLTVTRTVALGAVVLSSLMFPTFAQAGGQRLLGPPAVVAVDERGAAKDPKPILPPPPRIDPSIKPSITPPPLIDPIINPIDITPAPGIRPGTKPVKITPTPDPVIYPAKVPASGVK